MEDLKDHLARQDRHVRAAQTMKQSMRESIRSLQDRIKELEGGEGSEPVRKLQAKITQIGDENLKLKERIRKLEETAQEKDSVIQDMSEESERKDAVHQRTQDKVVEMQQLIQKVEFYADHAGHFKEWENSLPHWNRISADIANCDMGVQVPLRSGDNPRCAAKFCGRSYEDDEIE